MIKTTTIAFLLAMLFLSSCKKDSTPFQSYLRFKLDGVQIECYSEIESIYNPPNPTYLKISGKWTTGGYVGLEIPDYLTVLKPSTYKIDSINNCKASIWVPVPNTPVGNNTIYFAGYGGAFNPTLYGSGQITITEISDEYVKGTFDFISVSIISSQIIKTVTNGEFHIKR